MQFDFLDVDQIDTVSLDIVLLFSADFSHLTTNLCLFRHFSLFLLFKLYNPLLSTFCLFLKQLF